MVNKENKNTNTNKIEYLLSTKNRGFSKNCKIRKTHQKLISKKENSENVLCVAKNKYYQSTGTNFYININ